MPTTLEAIDLSKSFAGDPLFSRLSFRVERGVTAVTGSNGSGKTTLLKILASLLRPSTGTVRVQDRGSDLSGDSLRLAVGWAGPDLAFYEDFTAEENLRFFRRAAGFPDDPMGAAARLAEVGLTQAARQRVGTFSTGMEQRLRIAFSDLFDPPILLLDEPMTGLDAAGREAIERIISAKRQTGAVILASTDPRDFSSPEQVITLGGKASGVRRMEKIRTQIGDVAPGTTPHASRLMPHGGALARAWAIAAKDAAQELRRRIALTSVFFFAATALTLVSFAIGPFGLRPEDRPAVQAALLWIILFFSAATGLPRAFVREEETGTALALRRVTSGVLVLAGKTLFNYALFLAIAAVAVPGFAILLDWAVAAPALMAVIIVLAGWGLAAVSTFLSALVAQAGQKNVLFVVISFPMLLPLLLFAISGTLAATHGEGVATAIRVIVAYDGAASCAAYLLANAVWEN